ncbi:MAG: hypothetical protein ACYC8W_11260 [Candidatus Tyrphobacter sp.]
MTTLTQPLEFSVLCAPLAAIDRRALSQAWFSALGLSQRRSVSKGSRRLCASGTPLRLAASSLRSAPGCPHGRNVTTTAPSRERVLEEPGLGKSETLLERRRPSQLARRIERRFAVVRRMPRRASIVLAGERARVHLTLQVDASRTRIVAICPRAVERHVARALAEARYALARRGIALEARTKAGAPCT